MDGQRREGKGQIGVNITVVTNNEKNVPVDVVAPAIKIVSSPSTYKRARAQSRQLRTAVGATPPPARWPREEQIGIEATEAAVGIARWLVLGCCQCD